MNNTSEGENKIQDSIKLILKKAEEKEIHIDFAEDFIIGDINDPYTHTQIVDSFEALQDHDSLEIIDIGPRSSQKLEEIILGFNSIILWGETGDSRVMSGSKCTEELLRKLTEKKKIILVGGEIENFAKNIFEEELSDNFGFLGVRILSKLSDSSEIFSQKSGNENVSTDLENEQKRKKNYEIFVGGLPSDTTKEGLLGYFSQFGTILKCCPQFWGKKSAKKRKCKGFGTIICKEESTYLKIMEKKLHHFQDRKIECKVKLKKNKLAKYSKDLLNRKVFISGLPSYITSEKLETLLTEIIGQIEIAYVIKHRKSKKSRGFGFVVFKDQEAREKLLQAGYFMIKDRKIKCIAYEAKGEKKEKSPQGQIKLKEHKIDCPGQNIDDEKNQEIHQKIEKIKREKDQPNHIKQEKKIQVPKKEQKKTHKNLFMKLKEKRIKKQNKRRLMEIKKENLSELSPSLDCCESKFKVRWEYSYFGGYKF